MLNIGDRKSNYSEFEKKFVQTLDKQAPKKIQMFRGNHKPHIINSLRKALTKHSQLKNKANKTKDHKDILKYNRKT